MPTPKITNENVKQVVHDLEKQQLKRDAAKVRAEGDEELARHLEELSDRL